MRLQKTLSAQKHFEPIELKGPALSKEFLNLKGSLAKPKAPSQHSQNPSQSQQSFLLPPPSATMGSK